MRRFAALIALLVIILATSVSVVPVRAQPGGDGSIATFDLLVSSFHADYYRLSYWSDGLQIQALYAEPKDKTRTFPAVIYNRGGSADNGLIGGIELAPFAESGYVVVASQYRGAGGSQGSDQFGGDDVHDVLNLIPFLKSRALVDPNRIVMFGTSRGAMMTYLTLKAETQRKTRDIKAAATVSGVADLIMWSKERPDLNNGFFQLYIGASTIEDPQRFKDRSATYWAGMIRVPVLLQHGDGDIEVSAEQSKQLYRKLRANGRVAKLLIYPGDNHGLSGHEAGYPEAMRWFQQYIGLPGEDLTYEGHGDAIVQGREFLRRN